MNYGHGSLHKQASAKLIQDHIFFTSFPIDHHNSSESKKDVVLKIALVNKGNKGNKGNKDGDGIKASLTATKNNASVVKGKTGFGIIGMINIVESVTPLYFM